MRWHVVGAVLALIVVAAAAPAPAAGQDTLRLATLRDAAVRQDPRLGQVALEEAATERRLRSLAAERLPAFVLTAEATRQSEVAALPIDAPGLEVPTPPRDRYEVALSTDWLLLDGGVLGARRELERARLAAARAELAAELYPLRMEVTDAFFGALLLQERLRELSTLVEDLDARLSEVRARARAGAALPGDTAMVRAEMLRALQERAGVAADRRASLAVLAELTGRGVSEADVLALPDLDADFARARVGYAADRGFARPADDSATRVHPRYAAYEARREQLEREAAVIRARARPRLSAFGSYAYGRPGLAQFTDDLHDYWLAGLRLRWVPWDWGSVRRDVESVRLRQQILDTEVEAFSRRLLRQVQQPLQEIQRLRETLELDAQIIVLREQVERQARAQFGERAVTAAAYVAARTDLQEARTALLRHRVELARAQAQVLTTLGVELRGPR